MFWALNNFTLNNFCVPKSENPPLTVEVLIPEIYIPNSSILNSYNHSPNSNPSPNINLSDYTFLAVLDADCVERLHIFFLTEFI